MKEKYQFEGQKLTIINAELGVHIEQPFSPLRIPKEGVDMDGLVVEKNETGGVNAYFEIEQKLDGEFHRYYPNGELEMICFYSGGLLHGPSRFYSESGRCLSESWFYNGRREGASRRYYLSGELYAVEGFKGGLFHGKQKYYHEGGRVKSAIFYVQGKLEGMVDLYWPNGEKKRQCHFKGGARDGYDHMWSVHGILLDEGEYRMGDPVGMHRRFYENGNLRETRLYHSPQRFDCTKWGRDGAMLLQGVFDNSLGYEEKTWDNEGALCNVRKGAWRGGKLCWEDDAG